MYVKINNITGIDDALVSLLMSKRSWTEEKDREIRELCKKVLTREGFLNKHAPEDLLMEFDKKMNTLIKWGLKHDHEVLLRFINISITTIGLHRAGMDDIDSHAKRMDNRIIRSSTRLAKFTVGEKSDWYKDKILSVEEVFEKGDLIINLPESVDIDGDTWVKTPFGYVKKGYENDKDVLRGNYPLSIPSNFIWSIAYPELRHIYKRRGHHSHANPEVKEMIERVRVGLIEKMPILGHLLDKVYNEVTGGWVRIGQAVYVDKEEYERLIGIKEE